MTPAPQTHLVSADNQVLPTLGIAEISVKLNGLIVPFEFAVIPHLCNEVILGLDFLAHTHAVVDVFAKLVSFYDDIVIINLLNHFAKSDNIARVAQNYVVPPSSEAFIAVNVPKAYWLQSPNTATALLFESLPLTDETKCLVSRSLAETTDKIATIKVLNPFKHRLKLRKSQAIAQVQTVNSDILINLPPDFDQIVEDNVPAHANSTTKVAEQLYAASVEHEQLLSSPIIDELKIKIKNDKLTTAERNQLIKVLERNNTVFSRGMHDLPGTDIYEHHIEVDNHRPIRSQPYKHSHADIIEIDRQVTELLKSDIIYPTTSLWASPCLLVTKQNGDKRLVFDYRKVNQVINKISYPIALPSQIFDSIAEQKATIFSVLDMKSSYNQIKIAPESQDKTTFITHSGQYAFKRLPFGLSHSGSVFVAVITQLFRQNSFKNLNSYVDDLIVYSKNFPEHPEHLEYVFKTLNSVNLKLNPEKCDLCLSEVNYLGITVSEKGISINPKKLTVVQNYPVPKNTKQVRQFLGFVNFYRKFIPKYSIIAHPLNVLLRRDVAFKWNPQCQEAFDRLKSALVNPPVLAHADVKKPFILTTDASTSAIGWTLSQLDDNNKEHAILYGGRSLLDAESHWDVTSLEGIALVSAIKDCHEYLANNSFTVYTDHESLVNLRKTQNKSGRMLRWALMLQEYNYEIKHKSGVSNHVDALSRRAYKPESPEEQARHANDDEYDKIRVIGTNIDSNQNANHLNDEMRHVVSESSDICIDEPDFAHICEPVEMQLSYQTDEANATTNKQANIKADKLASIINLAIVQRSSPELKRFFDYLENDILPADDALARKTRFESESYLFEIKYFIIYTRRET